MARLRRTAPVLIATASGLALLASFHTTPSATLAVGSSPTSAAESALGATTTTTVKRSKTTAAPTTIPVRTVDGPAVPTKFGAVQVRVTLQGARILDVQALQLPSSHPRSTEISQQAAPLLRSEALQAQSARIDVLSGASYTSVGYANSLQAALDSARTA
ncbi:MAG: hypothetical protein QOJ00_1814 [Actinomycetota bacterium]|jgi:uncharacterized protein with FMN-binding domain